MIRDGVMERVSDSSREICGDAVSSADPAAMVSTFFTSECASVGVLLASSKAVRSLLEL